MRYPAFLKEHEVIGFVAPSFGCATEPYLSAFKNAQRNFTQKGYGLQLGPNCYAEKGIGISNTPKLCGEELTEGYLSEDNQVLISCGGGELMCEILPFVDFEKIKKATPKWYMGFSDNTNFTFLLNTLCDTASIYGPCAASFGMEPWHPAIADAFSLLCGEKLQDGAHKVTGYELWEKESYKTEENPYASYHVTEPSVLHGYIGDGKPMDEQTIEYHELAMKGRLIGGCLDCLVNLCGTKFDQVKAFQERYKEDGIIWFLEACDLNVMGIRRALWELEQAGWFQYTKGFLIGRPMHFHEDMMGLDQYKAVYDVVSHYRVPVLMDVDLGHLPPMTPVISGSMATVYKNGNEWSMDMELI